MTTFDKLLTIGDTLELQFSDPSHPDPMKTGVYKVIDDRHLLIAVPIRQASYCLVPLGKVAVYRYSHEKLGIFTFKGKVVRRLEHDNLKALIVERVSPIEKKQRRAYYRMPFVAEVTLSRQAREPVVENEIIIDDGRESFQGLSIDLSAGGLRLKTRYTLDSEMIYLVTFQMGRDHIALEATVQRYIGFEGRYYEYGLAFVDLSEKDKKRIVRYIFDRERQLLDKGMV